MSCLRPVSCEGLPHHQAALPVSPGKGAHTRALILAACLAGWALGAVTSRAFRTRGPKHPAALLPLIDMCNHSFEPNCQLQPTPSGGVKLV